MAYLNLDLVDSTDEVLAALVLAPTLIDRIKDVQRLDPELEKVKIEHQRPARLLQPLEISQWKWEHITMDFVVALPRTKEGHDTIWVIVDRLNKSAYFLPIANGISMKKLVKMYISDIICLHGVPVGNTVSLKSLFDPTKVMAKEYLRSLNPLDEVGGQALRPNWCEIQIQVAMSPSGQLIRSYDLQQAIQDALGAPIAWPYRLAIFVVVRPLEFNKGDKIYLKIFPSKDIMRFGKSEKLSPRYIGPFEILERVGNLAYHLALPPALSKVHNVFHVSQLRKYVSDPSHVLEVRENTSYKEHPVKIVDLKDQVLR
nr:uncharacterized protein LOC113710067 [Coffea arabica]